MVEVALTVATGLALLALFAGTELACRRGYSPTGTRRFAHVVGASTAACFPLYLHLRDVISLAVLFTVFLGWTALNHWLPSIHAVPRPTVGASVFPAGLGVAALLAWPHPHAYALAALVLALADPAAAMGGERFGGPSWPVPGGRKTLGGSLCCVAVALGLAIIFAFLCNSPRAPGVIAFAVLCAAIEGSTGYGLDNLTLPPVAAMLAIDVIGL